VLVKMYLSLSTVLPCSFVALAAASSSSTLLKIQGLVASHDNVGLKRYLTDLRTSESPTGTYITEDFVALIGNVVNDIQVSVIDVVQNEQVTDQQQIDQWTQELQAIQAKSLGSGMESSMNSDKNYIECVDQEVALATSYESSRDDRDEKHADMTTKCNIVASWPLVMEKVPVPTMSCVIGETCDAANTEWSTSLKKDSDTKAADVRANQAAYDAAVVVCNDATTAHDKAATDASSQLTTYQNKHQVCENVLDTRFVVFCRWGFDLNQYCNTQENYKGGVETSLADEQARNELWESSHKTTCLLNQWIAGESLEIDATCSVPPLQPQLWYNKHMMATDPLCLAPSQTFFNAEYDVPPDAYITANSSAYVKLTPWQWDMNHERGTSPFAFCSNDAPITTVQATSTFAATATYMSTWFRLGAYPFHKDNTITITEAPQEMLEGIMIQGHVADYMFGQQTTIIVPGAGFMYSYCDPAFCGAFDDLANQGWSLMKETIQIKYCTSPWWCPSFSQPNAMKIYKKAVKAEEKVVFTFKLRFTGGWNVQLSEY